MSSSESPSSGSSGSESDSEGSPPRRILPSESRSTATSSTTDFPTAGDNRLRFEIPGGDDDLTVMDAGAFHVVQEGDLDEERIKSEIDQFDFKLSDKSLVAIKEHFDAFFSLAKINSKVKNTDLQLKAVKKLLKYFELLFHGSLVSTLSDVLQTEGQPSLELIDECNLQANYLLMTVYLLNRLTIHLESELMKRLLAAEKRKGARKQELDNEMEQWTNLREKVIDCFTRICDLSIADYASKLRSGAIRFLWRPPEVNKGMMLSFTETVFKLLENPTCTRVSSLKWLEKIFQLVRAMCIRFEYFHRMAVALVDKTVGFEYLAEASQNRYPFIQPILNVSNKDDMDPLLCHMIHHLGDLIDMNFAAMHTKPYCLLMTTMAEMAPEVMMRQLPAIVPYLKKDVNSLRSAVLSVFSSLLCSPALNEQICQQYSRRHKVRNSLLNFLMDHLYDNNAMTRSRAVNIWSNLAECNRIPREILNRALVSKIGERLEDKSVQVRKAAVHFLSKFLEGNPYGHDFNYDLHKQKLFDLATKRRSLLNDDPEMATVNAATAAFDAKEEEIKQHVEHHVGQHMAGHGAIVNLQGATVEAALVAIGSQVLVSPEYCARIVTYLAFTSQLEDIPIENNFARMVHNICEFLRSVYLRKCFTDRNGDNDAQLEEEERMEDYQRELDKNARELNQLRDKMLVAMEFAECLPLAMRAVLYGEVAEQKEGMNFVVKCKHFNVSGADAAVRMLCSLIWKNNQDIRAEVLKTAQQLFVSTHSQNHVRVGSTVCNLISVLEGMKEEERACVEEVICRMAVTGLPQGVTKQVWKIIDQSEPAMKIVALQLYGILTRADKTLRKSLRNLQQIVRDKQMPPRVRSEALAAIAHMADESKRSDIMEKVFRIPANDSLFSTIESFVIDELFRPPSDSSPIWCDVFQNALTICFGIGKDTCLVASRLMAKVLAHTHRVSQCARFYNERYTVEPDEEKLKGIKEQKANYNKMFVYMTERCLVMCGELALRTVIHVDVTYFREVKRLPEVINMIKRGEIQPTKASNRPLKDWEVRSAMHKGMFDYSSKDDNNPQGSTDEERVRSRADQVLDNHLFRDGKLLTRIVPFVMYCLRAEGSPENIRNAAAVAFSKLMLVSRGFSERGAPAFFMLLNNSDSPVLRNNLMIAAGDLCFRMPNLVEKYATNVYLMTNDAEPMVRETAILVLTHLLTNQMLKHRGCIADVAKLYTDRVPDIRSLTGQFFKELGARGSIIYNLMPDFISRLSKNSRDVNLQQFKTIMGFLIALIQKDKQIDSLVEKLCTRFEYAKTEKAKAKNKEIAHYFSYCISQLQLSDKSFYKMRDAMSCYAEFLEDPVIYKDFTTCLATLAKTTKNSEILNDMEEFSQQLEKMHLRGLRTDEMNLAKRMNDKKAARAAAKRAVRAPREKKKRLRVIDSESEDSS